MDKQKKIINMFNNIAKSYDKTNRLISIGIDLKWRKIACNNAFKIYDNRNIDSIVDVACGTGDLILSWKKVSKNKYNVKKYIGIDPSIQMLNIAKQKVEDAVFINSYADDLKIPVNSADIISISYGLRNIIKREDALIEFYSKLKQNGLLVILEFMKDNNKGFFKSFKNIYINNVLPIIGRLISKDKEAYKYLSNSINEFITNNQLKKELKDIGFEIVFEKNFLNNVTSLIIAKKI